MKNRVYVTCDFTMCHGPVVQMQVPSLISLANLLVEFEKILPFIHTLSFKRHFVQNKYANRYITIFETLEQAGVKDGDYLIFY